MSSTTTTAPKPAQRLRKRRPVRPAAVVKNLGALLLALVFVFPVYWMFSSALKPSSQMLTKDPVFVFTPTLDNFTKATGVSNFWTYVTNSVLVTVGAVALALLVALAASFAIARMRFKGRKGLVLTVMMAQMAPGRSWSSRCT